MAPRPYRFHSDAEAPDLDHVAALRAGIAEFRAMLESAYQVNRSNNLTLALIKGVRLPEPLPDVPPISPRLERVTAYSRIIRPQRSRRRGSNARLTETQVREILRSTEPDIVLAVLYGCTTNNIWCIRNGHTWMDLWQEWKDEQDQQQIGSLP